MMDPHSYSRFTELRQEYYLAGRSLLISNLFGPAGINFGYAIELSLKFILVFNGHTKGMRNHNIENYYDQVVGKGYIPNLRVSRDFLQFVNERLNTRYPSMTKSNLAEHKAESRTYVFSIDMLHCYDDLYLQLDDAIAKIVDDSRISTGFRCCRDLMSISGRIFFHCNDHAFQRIHNYIGLLSDYKDEEICFHKIKSMLEDKLELWNFKGLMAVRPWGPKYDDWSPASEFTHPKEGAPLLGAKWTANNVGINLSLTSMQLTLEEGSYGYKISEKIISPEDKT